MRKIKCGADERRRCRLDGTEQSYLPTANMQTNLLKSEPPSGGLFAGIKKNIPDGKTSGMFQSVKKPSASLDTVGAAFRRPRNNCGAIVAVFEEKKNDRPWRYNFVPKLPGDTKVAPTEYSAVF